MIRLKKRYQFLAVLLVLVCLLSIIVYLMIYPKEEGAYRVYNGSIAQLHYNYTYDYEQIEYFFGKYQFVDSDVKHSSEFGWATGYFNHSSEKRIYCYIRGQGLNNSTITLVYKSENTKHYKTKSELENDTAELYTSERGELEKDVNYFIGNFDREFDVTPTDINYIADLGFWSPT